MEDPQVTALEDAAQDSALPPKFADRLADLEAKHAASPIAELPQPPKGGVQGAGWGVPCPSPPASADLTTVAPRYEALRISDVVPQRTRWLWPRRLPLGTIVTLDGDPDVGKSMLCCDLAAHITTGRALPGAERPTVPKSPVVIMTLEDDVAETIRPRLEAAGADIDLVHYFKSVPIYNEGRLIGSTHPSLPDDVPALEELITHTGAVLVVVDMLMAYLSGQVNSWSDHGMRRALAPLIEMSRRTSTCIVLLRHFPKSQRQGGNPMTAGSGSMGIIGPARSGMVAGLDPSDSDGHRRVLARAKGNLAGWWASLAYQVTCNRCARPDCAGTGEDDEDHVPVIRWLGETDVSGRELLAGEPTDDERSTLDEAADWVRIVLELASGEMQFRDLLELAGKEGYSRGQLDRVRKRLLAVKQLTVTRDKKTSGAPATWRLEPSDDAVEPA